MAQATREEISLWVRKHRDVYEISADDLYGYIRKPLRTELNIKLCEAQENICEFTEEVLEKCWLGGDEKLKIADNYFLGISKQISQIIETTEVTLQKLEPKEIIKPEKK